MKAEESVPAVRYLWVDQNLDLLSVEEEEAETGIRADTADDLGPVLLGRLYPVMDLLKSEQIEYQIALDKELHPYLLVTINSLGLEQLMEIRCIADEEMKSRRGDTKTLVTGGICCGLALGIASSLQQWGILFTTVGKAGFITAMYIVLVPIFGIFLGKKVRLLIWFCVALAVAGLYFLCMNETFRLNTGDFLVILCAVCFSVHILVIDHFSPKVDGVRLSAIQFLVAGIACGIPMLIWEHPELPGILAASMPLLYAGVMSCGVAYTLQIIAQKNADPTVASLLLSLESVFSVLAGWVILHQSLSIRELFGCVLMFGAIILAQLPEKTKA